jgi:hypothetical protein
VTDLSKIEARAVVALIDSATSTQLSGHLISIRDKLVRGLAEEASARAFGDLVFRMVLPLKVDVAPGPRSKRTKPLTLALAPTLNSYASMESWQRQKVYQHVDVRIMAEMAAWPRCKLMANPRPRGVRVTRYSSVLMDEVSVDSAGGKIVIDRLVHAGILMGDTSAQLQREARWERAAPGGGNLLVEIFDLA